MKLSLKTWIIKHRPRREPKIKFHIQVENKTFLSPELKYIALDCYFQSCSSPFCTTATTIPHLNILTVILTHHSRSEVRKHRGFYQVQANLSVSYTCSSSEENISLPLTSRRGDSTGGFALYFVQRPWPKGSQFPGNWLSVRDWCHLLLVGGLEHDQSII